MDPVDDRALTERNAKLSNFTTAVEERENAMPKLGTKRHWPGIALLLCAVVAGAGLSFAIMTRPTTTDQSGWAEFKRGEWDKAAATARARLKTKPADTDAVRLLARSSVRLGRDDAARSLFRRLGPEAMEAEDLYLLGLTLSRIGDAHGAFQVWEQARQLEPKHADTLEELAHAYLVAERPLAAEETAKVLATITGRESKAERLLGSIRAKLGDPEAALAHWQNAGGTTQAGQGGAAETVPSPKALARALLQLGRPVEAQTALGGLMTQTSDAESFWLLSRARLQQHAIPEALAAWKSGASFRTSNPLAPEPARKVGSDQCASCHRGIYQTQRGSRHARTFFRGSELSRLDLPPARTADPSNPRVSHTLRHAGNDRLEQETQVDGRTYRAIVEYAFGSGDRGLTLVGRETDGQARELRLSHYRTGSRVQWDITAGHVVVPEVSTDFLGQALTEDAVRRCLICHVTEPQSELEKSKRIESDHGIGCERCHGPGGNHLLAVADKFPDLAIARPTLARGAPVVKLCGECHSPLGRTVTPEESTAVRFQATTLTWSRCYAESNEALDCVTCHDPHRNVSKSIADYESKCLSCHSTGSALPLARKEGRKVRLEADASPVKCPVNPKSGCIGCHMPAVSEVVPHSTFTDHFIRVHRD